MSKQSATEKSVANGGQAAAGVLRRKCDCGGRAAAGGGECSACSKKKLHRRRRGNGEFAEAPPLVEEVLRSPGQALDAATQTDMGERFGHDFSHVRVHTDARASESAAAVDALAYTVGRDVVFGAGQYAPHSDSGKGLLAHELTHVLQAGNAAPTSGAIEIGRADAGEERAAEQSEMLAGAARPTVGYSAANLLQRKTKGGSVGGFFANIGRAIAGIFTSGEMDYDKKTLDEYLDYLRTNGDIEDDFDSDNKARDIAERDLFKGESTGVRALLVREMLTGATWGADEEAIIRILQAATPDERAFIAETVTYDKLYDKFSGKNLDTLYALLPKMEFFHPRGKKELKTHSLEDFIKKWETDNGKALSATERQVLAKGCIGITMLHLGTTSAPDLRECYGSFEKAWMAAKTMNEYLAANAPDKKAYIFSKRFWSSGDPYKPDPQTGRVDMSNYRHNTARPSEGGSFFINFDYGFYDEATGKWWHANHCDSPTLGPGRCEDPEGNPLGPMTVYESNLANYSKPLRDFDKQVFCVSVANKK